MALVEAEAMAAVAERKEREAETVEQVVAMVVDPTVARG
jgi:hypothetical protein